MFKKGDIVEIVGKEYEVIGVELEACDKPIVRIADRYWANGVGDLQPVYELHDRNRRKMKKVGDAFMTKVQNVYWSNGAGDLHHGGFEDLKEEQLPDQLRWFLPFMYKTIHLLYRTILLYNDSCNTGWHLLLQVSYRLHQGTAQDTPAAQFLCFF